MATDAALGGESLIFPIGHHIGTRYDDPYSLDRHHDIMVGAQVLQLSDEQLAVWLLARGLPKQVTEASWTRRQLEQEAGRAGISDASRVLTGLTADGLVVQLPPGTERIIDFAESYRLVPLMLGLGNTAEEPWLYRIGFFNQPVASVASDVYSMWEWAHLDNSLWAACHTYADTSRRAGSTDPDDTIPERVLSGFLGAVHQLLAVSAAYLDLAWLDPAAEQA